VKKKEKATKELLIYTQIKKLILKKSLIKIDNEDESIEIEGLREGGMCRGGGKAIRGKGFKGVF
jgi:hypothetical protein